MTKESGLGNEVATRQTNACFDTANPDFGHAKTKRASALIIPDFGHVNQTITKNGTK
jgi:hypothetical protein